MGELKITEEEREALSKRLDDIDAARDKIAKAMEPFRAADQVLKELHDSLVDHLPDIQGKCETCNRLLFEGEVGYRYDDDPILCADHAPTWGDIKRAIEREPESWSNDEERLEFVRQAVAAHETRGGSLDEKVLHTL